MKYIDFEDEQVSIPIPDDWVVEVEPLGFQAWAHSPDEKIGVSEVGATKEQAVTKLAHRMAEWLIYGGR